jgi:hypothetical protein
VLLLLVIGTVTHLSRIESDVRFGPASNPLNRYVALDTDHFNLPQVARFVCAMINEKPVERSREGISEPSIRRSSPTILSGWRWKKKG